MFLTHVEDPGPIHWMGYDWIGDNIYFASKEWSLGLCSRRTFHCTGIRNWTGQDFRYPGPLMALDPKRG